MKWCQSSAERSERIFKVDSLTQVQQSEYVDHTYPHKPFKITVLRLTAFSLVA